MKRYRENQEAAGNQATAEKPGGFGTAKGGGGTLPGPPSAFTEREMRYFKEPCRRRAVPPRGIAAEGLRYQGAVPPRGYAAKRLRRQEAVPPRGCAAKGLYRQGFLSPKRSAAKGGNQARYLLPRTRTAPARTATVIRLSHGPWRLRQRCWGCRCRYCRYCRRCWRWDRRRRRRYTCHPCSCGRRRG